MTDALIFVVALVSLLPGEATSRAELEQAQACGHGTGFALWLFSRGRDHGDLAALPLDPAVPPA